MIDIRLSICIATLNRRDFLGETLTALLAQWTEGVELVVVDGASSDGTNLLVQELFRDRPDCRYIRLAEKGGVDQDYSRAVEEATGDYCWLMTDDDLPTADAVSMILAGLVDGPDLLMVNAEVNVRDFARVLKPRKCEIADDRDFQPVDHDSLMAAAGDLLSFIGSVVIRREIWMARDRAAYFGTEFVHVGVIFQKPLERHARLIARPLIRIRYGNAQWTDRAFEIWMFQWPGLIWSFASIAETAKAAVTPREPWRRLIFLVMMKVRGCFTIATYRQRLAAKNLSPRERSQAWALARFPETLFNAIISLFVAPLVPRNACLKYELRSSPFDFNRRWFGRGQKAP